MRLIIIGLFFISNLAYSQKKHNQQQWISLFNGKNLDHWTTKIFHHETGDNFAQTFRVKNKTIQVRYDGYPKFENRYGHLYYDTPYSYYILQLDYKFTGIWRNDAPIYTERNSGVMFHSQSPKTMPKEQDWPISVEMQFLAGLDNGKPRPTGNMCSPGTDVVFKGKKDPRHCTESSSKTYPMEQWVKAELRVYGDSLVQHFINNELVLEYEKPSVGGLVATGYLPEYKKDGMPLTSGHIALQSEGQEIDLGILDC